MPHSALSLFAVCNATIDSVTVLQRSGRSYGMIKSSNMDTPAVCSFTLVPDAKQRVEIQLYRLVGVGRYHNNRSVPQNEGASLFFAPLRRRRRLSRGAEFVCFFSA